MLALPLSFLSQDNSNSKPSSEFEALVCCAMALSWADLTVAELEVVWKMDDVINIISNSWWFITTEDPTIPGLTGWEIDIDLQSGMLPDMGGAMSNPDSKTQHERSWALRDARWYSRWITPLLHAPKPRAIVASVRGVNVHSSRAPTTRPSRSCGSLAGASMSCSSKVRSTPTQESCCIVDVNVCGA